MRWSYFKNIRNLDIKSFFNKKNMISKDQIKNYLIKNNFTFSEEELKDIYDIVLPKPIIDKVEEADQASEEKETIEVIYERESSLLSQKKKSLRSYSKGKSNVSGSMDTIRRN